MDTIRVAPMKRYKFHYVPKYGPRGERVLCYPDDATARKDGPAFASKYLFWWLEDEYGNRICSSLCGW